MDTLNRKILNINDTVWFYISPKEQPYTYLRMNGIVKDVKKVYDNQIIYLVQPKNILETRDIIHHNMNGNHWKVWEIKRSVSKWKAFWSFDKRDRIDSFLGDITSDYLFEISSAVSFQTEKEMRDNFQKSMVILKKILQNNIKKIDKVLNS